MLRRAERTLSAPISWHGFVAALRCAAHAPRAAGSLRQRAMLRHVRWTHSAPPPYAAALPPQTRRHLGGAGQRQPPAHAEVPRGRGPHTHTAPRIPVPRRHGRARAHTGQPPGAHARPNTLPRTAPAQQAPWLATTLGMRPRRQRRPPPRRRLPAKDRRPATGCCGPACTCPRGCGAPGPAAALRAPHTPGRATQTGCHDLARTSAQAPWLATTLVMRPRRRRRPPPRRRLPAKDRRPSACGAGLGCARLAR